MNEIKRLSSVLKHRGVLLDFYEDNMLLPNGHEVKWDRLEHGNAAASVAVDNEGKILMVKQYRGPVDRITLEIPAGCADNNEEPLDVCAARELEEETGYRPGKMMHLMDIYPAISYSDEMIGIYLATELQMTAADPDDDEFLNVFHMDPDELISMIYDGRIKDSKTAAGILAYDNIRRSGKI